MPRFGYRALSAAGDVVVGELDGPDAASIISRLHEQALLPIDATEKNARAAQTEFRIGRRRTLPGRELAMFSQQLARLLKAGLPLDRALDILGMLARDARVAKAVRQTLEKVRDGSSLAEAMAAQEGAFPQAYLSMVRAGEIGGALQGVLSRLAEFLIRSEAIRQKVVSAMIYPSILAVVAIGSVILVLTVVLPQFKPLFEDAGSKLPASTRFVMAAGDIVRDYWWMMLVAAAGVAVMWQQIMRQPAVVARRDRLLLVIPLLRELISKFEIGRFARTLGVLLANGVAAPRALALCGAAVGNRAIADAIEVVALRFTEGEGLSEPLARTGRFPNLSTQLIRIGEETGRLEEMLEEVADIYDQDVQRALERLLALLVPAITIVMGAVIAGIVVSILTAMIGITDLAV